MSLADKTFLHALQKQTVWLPNRIALSDAGETAITYSQTQKYANHVSQKVTQAGVSQGDIVVIFLVRTALFPFVIIHDDMDYIISASGTTGKSKETKDIYKGLMDLINFYAEELKLNERKLMEEAGQWSKTVPT